MKQKSLFIPAFISSVVLIVSACVEELSINEQYRPAGTEIVFSAATGYENGDDTRTEYSGVLYGETVGATTKQFERIDWVNNDGITIYYLNGTSTPISAEYQVSGVSGTTDKNSYADVQATGSKLLWGAAASHKFYALYPANGTINGASISSSGGTYRVTGVIPTTQTATKRTVNGTAKYLPDMDYGYLVGYKEITASDPTSTVLIPFTPATTTFEFQFKLGSTLNSYPIREFRMVTDNATNNPLTGEFSFNITGGDNSGATWVKTNTGNPTTGTRVRSVTGVATASNTISVRFDTDGNGTTDDVAMSNSSVFDFTVFAVPVDITHVTLEIEFSNGQIKRLPLKTTSGGTDTWYPFQAAKKYRITNYVVPAEEGEWTYVIEPIADISVVGHMPVSGLGFTVKSYKYSTLNPSVKVAVPWRVQYSSTGTANSWSNTNGSADFSLANVTGDGVSNSTYTTGEPNSANIANSTTPTTSGTNTAAAIIQRMQALSDASPRSDWDLSMHNIFGESNAKGRTTANCYVVDRAGTYKFPAYFGNAYTNGRINWNAFRPGDNSQNTLASQISDQYVLDPSRPLDNAGPNPPYMGDGYDSVRYLRDFRDATNNGIIHYSIKNHYQNLANAYGTAYTPSQSDFEAVIVWQNSMTGTPIVQDNSTAVRYDWSTDMIYFTIDRNDIQPGNIVIALRGKVGTTLPAGTILWSWHIWVSDKDLHPADVTNANNVTVGLMPRNLGSMDRTGMMWGEYPDRYYYFNIVQTETGGTQEDFKVEQIGDGFSIDGNLGTNTYYQWGRKDPMIPADPYNSYVGPNPNGTNVTIYKDLSITNGSGPGVIPGNNYSTIFGSNGSGQSGNSDSATTLTGAMGPPAFIQNNAPQFSIYNQTDYSDYAEGIKYPYKHFLNQESTGWIGGNINMWMWEVGQWTFGFPIHRANSAIPYNLWNASIYGTQDKGGDDKYKTIYDPCPPGFCVPNLSVFSGLEYIETVTNEGNYYSDGRGGRVFFPFTGLRVFYNMTTYCELETEEVASIGYIWTDCPTAIKNNGQEAWYYAKALSFGGTATYPPSTTFDKGHNDYTRGSAMPIRPMVDPKFDK